MRLRVTYATLSIILMLSCAACGGDSPQEARPLTDDLGRPVSVESIPTRVVTLAPSLTEMVFAVGAGEKLVGVGRPDDYPPMIDSLPRYATYPVDFEAITALAPDLVLATDQVNSTRDAETLDALGIPTYFLSFGSIEDVFRGLRTVGSLLGTEQAAQSAIDSLKREVAAIRNRTALADPRPTVLFLIGPETLFSFGHESYVHEMIDIAGGRSVTSDLNVRAPVLSEEYVLERAPDVILGSWGDDVQAHTLLQHHPSWDLVPAVRDGRVYGLDASLVTRPGPRLIEGIRSMAQRLHPNLLHGRPDVTPNQ